MTIKERVENILNGSYEMDDDCLERLVFYAYWMGRECATKYVSDAYKKLLSEQIARAKKERYHRVAMRVQGNIRYLYMPDYSQDVTEMCGDKETTL